MSVGWKIERRGRVSYYPRLRKRTRTVPLVQQERDRGGALECRYCGKYLNCLTSHLPRIHGISCVQYRLQFPGEALHAASSLAQRSATHRLRYGHVTCRYCKKIFFYRSQRHEKHRQGTKPKFCSPRCHFDWRSQWKHQMGTIHRTCESCGCIFTVRKSYLKTRAGRWCSVACRWKQSATARPVPLNRTV